MKTWINNLLVLAFCSLALVACDKDEERLIASPGTPPALTASQTSLVLEEENKSRDAVTFSWTPSRFGFDAAVNYTLEFALEGSNFEGARAVQTTNNTMRTFTVGELNGIANEIGLPTFSPENLMVRVKAQVSEFYEPVYSTPITLVVNSYLTEPAFPTLYMVGSATEFEWNENKGTPMFRTLDDPFIYTYTGRFKAGDVKFLGELGKWAPQYGNDGSGKLAFRETEEDPDPSAFSIPADGYYTVTLNLRNNNFTLEPYDEGGAATYNSIGIIGAFNDWGDIVPMTKSTLTPHTWSLEHTFAADTELKFRIAEGWDVNWGANEDVSSLYGTGGQGKDNLKIPAGSYRILFNDMTGEYLFIQK